MNTWNELAEATARWSIPNFGTTAGLGCLAPLMGIGEEIGELAAADSPEEVEDAIGDIGIYLANYCALSGVDMDKAVAAYTGPVWQHVAVAYGKLLHARLKRAQKIRGMDDDAAFRKAESFAVGMLVARVNDLSLGKFFGIASHTWGSIVSKRKWHDKPLNPISLNSLLGDFSGIALDLNSAAHAWYKDTGEGVPA